MRKVSAKAIVLLTVFVLFDGVILPTKRRNSSSPGQGSKKAKDDTIRNTDIYDYLTSPVHRVVVFNVGQGNGVIVETEKAFWVVDFGSMGEPTFWAKQASVYTKENRVKAARKMLNGSEKEIIVLITHPDADHYNLIADLLDPISARVKHWIMSPKYGKEHFTDNTPAFLTDKNRFAISNALIKTQVPDEQSIIFLNAGDFANGDINSHSIILLVKIADIEHADESKVN